MWRSQLTHALAPVSFGELASDSTVKRRVVRFPLGIQRQRAAFQRKEDIAEVQPSEGCDAFGRLALDFAHAACSCPVDASLGSGRAGPSTVGDSPSSCATSTFSTWTTIAVMLSNPPR